MPLLVGVHGRVSLGHLLGYLGLTSPKHLAGAGDAGQPLAGTRWWRPSSRALVSLLVVWLLAGATEPPFSKLLSAVALHNAHFPPFQSGQIHLRDVVYYLVLTWTALFATTRVLEARRWR